jgi:hypothetical protein
MQTKAQNLARIRDNQRKCGHVFLRGYKITIRYLAPFVYNPAPP